MPTLFMPDPLLLGSPRHRAWPGLALRAGGAARRGTGTPADVDVVIVGAGPAGLGVAAALWHHGVRDVLVLDPNDHPCERFFARIDLLGQRVLRSPYEHHPGVEGYRDCELRDFARLHWSRLTDVERREIRMSQAGHRSVVPVDVFEAYCAHVAATHHLPERFRTATVRELHPGPHGVLVRTGDFDVRARFVVLATGEERQTAPSTWWDGAEGPGRISCPISYWDTPVPAGIESVTVVGAGLTAAHLLANALAAGQQVHWVMREPEERYQCADVNAAFFRAEGRARFDGVPWPERLELTNRYRRASVMFEFWPRLRQAEADGLLSVHRGQAVTGVRADAGAATVRLADGTRVVTDHAVLALGTRRRTGAELMPADLVGARDGWPDLDERTLAYRRAPRVFAVGAAAGMVLGPAARNIDGHRVATARVAAAITTGLPAPVVARPARPSAPAPDLPEDGPSELAGAGV